MNRNAQEQPTIAINGIAIHQSVISDKPMKTNVVIPIPILNFVTFLIWILFDIRFITINAVSVFATYTIETSYNSAPKYSINIIGSMVQAAAAPIWRINSDEKRNLFVPIIFFIVPFATIFSVFKSG